MEELVNWKLFALVGWGVALFFWYWNRQLSACIEEMGQKINDSCDMYDALIDAAHRGDEAVGEVLEKCRRD